MLQLKFSGTASQRSKENNLQSELIIKKCSLYDHFKTKKVNKGTFYFTIEPLPSCLDVY